MSLRDADVTSQQPCLLPLAGTRALPVLSPPRKGNIFLSHQAVLERDEYARRRQDANGGTGGCAVEKLVGQDKGRLIEELPSIPQSRLALSCTV